MQLLLLSKNKKFDDDVIPMYCSSKGKYKAQITADNN